MFYTGDNLNEVLNAHKEWLLTNDRKKGNLRAVFGGSDCSELDFSNMDLRGAEFYDADLDGCDFHECNLAASTFINCKVEVSKFNSASLSGAQILHCLFPCSDFSHADFMNATIVDTDFSYSVFTDAKTDGTYWKDCHFNNNVLDIPYIPMACPDTGGFVGWKKAVVVSSLNEQCRTNIPPSYARSHPCIVKLWIPEDAERSSANGNKCRCSKAVVLEFQDMKGNTLPDHVLVRSFWDPTFVYKVEQTAVPSFFYPDRFEECSGGIHFYINRQDACNHQF